jgi:micrococcal nuclease
VPRRLTYLLLLTLLALLLGSTTASPHGGGIDRYGCHHDRKHGGYHCHRGEFSGRSFASQAEMLAARQARDPVVPPAVPSVQFSGKVVGITDGDTISVMHNGRAEKIRLNGIDCPEKGQAYGIRAKQFTSDMVFGKDVTLRTHGLDKYGRTIGDVILSEGTNLNQELVKEGLAWWYRKYAPNDSTLEHLEEEARTAKRGLWADPRPVPPWCWRKLPKKAAC